MKKLLFSTLLMLAISANAQVYQKGSKFINVGLGLSPGIGVIGSVDLGVHESISAGVFGSYQTWGILGTLNYGRVGVGGKADFHLGKVLQDAKLALDLNKIDPYVGANLGLGIFTGSYTGTNKTHLIGGGHLGVRYMAKPNLGFFGEVGYDVMYLKAGVSMKLGK
jgi:hypothetical protein